MKRAAVLVMLPLLFVATSSAFAKSPAFGVRGGFTIDPDQIHFGGHVDVLEFGEGFGFVPNLEIGFGDNATLFAINGEVIYTFPRTDWKTWRPYVGGGIGYNISKLDDDGMPEDFDDTHTDIGLNVLAGIGRTLNIGYDFFAEFKLGIEDSPDGKITLGLTFH